MWNGWFLYSVGIWNLIVFFLYGWDRLCAKKHWNRIGENFLLFTAVLLGSCGALFGMVVWNHKTSKMKFRLLVPLLVFVNIWLTGWILTLL